MPEKLIDLIQDSPEIEIALTTQLSEELLAQAEELIEDSKALYQQHRDIKRRWYELGQAIFRSSNDGSYIN